ncbi:hypothetical protein Pmar_PMAR007212 [Perkinsus marinus ATCC 50983]|uniref:Uncharacterized protein n=1 Tax=Perkinsus marinus (strain ATCC 50983 / TXsc) TaxID=423536 RepID=C5LWN6_PERM5|nr:hypothetical protein Pmar_PMAR007212 [Perkinsus marinus ATCC 50983]EEQ98831.1 hypothetical protein Pmar_PMAR007212 [Perkinsus marinus ATCC 50983]|eukprot:XP_002766114.1 hypothetical protein Pmar_PMAR007212 [Perkinsus marinus ATCC 50983]
MILKEGRWDHRHTVVFSKDNEHNLPNQRSYFDRHREPLNFSTHPSLNDGLQSTGLKPTWKLPQEGQSPSKSVFRSSFYEPCTSEPPWLDRHHILFSKGNPTFGKNLRSYFDRPRELSVTPLKDSGADDPTFPRQLDVTWSLPPDGEKIKREQAKIADFFHPPGVVWIPLKKERAAAHS